MMKKLSFRSPFGDMAIETVLVIVLLLIVFVVLITYFTGTAETAITPLESIVTKSTEELTTVAGLE